MGDIVDLCVNLSDWADSHAAIVPNDIAGAMTLLEA